MGTLHLHHHRSGGGIHKKSNDGARLVITTIIAVVFGYVVGVSFPSLSVTKLRRISSLLSSTDAPNYDQRGSFRPELFGSESDVNASGNITRIYVPTNPRGAELLPPGIVVSETDFYLRRLWGDPNEDLKTRPKYLVTFTVGFAQRNNINAAIKKFTEDFTILLFHYDGRTSEWDQFDWSKRAIHVSVKKQTKWYFFFFFSPPLTEVSRPAYAQPQLILGALVGNSLLANISSPRWYAKRFLHPDVVAAYDYIFIWDEDLGVEHFNAEKYIQLVKKHGLDISQPGLEPNNGLTWQMTKRRGDREVHKETEEKPGWCSDPHLPPCAAFVEIMAPVFSREAWRCVWHMIQNDLVHGWGLDFALRRCVEPAHEKIGVVDSQWIVHQVIPSLGNQGESEKGKAPWEGVRERCRSEWTEFRNRLANADKAYFSQMGKAA